MLHTYPFKNLSAFKTGSFNVLSIACNMQNVQNTQIFIARSSTELLCKRYRQYVDGA
jgi:hypothetical protein